MTKRWDVTYYKRFDTETKAGKKGMSVKIGMGITDEEHGSIDLYLHSTPIDFNGKLRLYPQKPRDNEPVAAEPEGDEIPI
jgi:hypothetical protein